MSKTLTYSSFLAASLLVILAFITAKSYTQLTIAVILFPALAYFALRIFPRKGHAPPIITISIPAAPAQKAVARNNEKVEVVDIDKRTFLKFVGAAGISFFVFSILGERVRTLLFGNSLAPGISAPESATGGVGTAQAIPTAGYSVSEIDEGAVSYYGFTNKAGAWLIMREDTEKNSFRYARGNSGFPINWTNRENLKYDYYYNLF